MRRILFVVMLLVPVVTQAALRYLQRTTPSETSFETVSTDFVSDTHSSSRTYDDAVDQDVSIGFTFPFNSTSYTIVHINSNGTLSFTNNSDTAYSNGHINNHTQSQIFPYWDDLNLGNANDGAHGRIRYDTLGSGSSQHFVVSWEGVPHFSNSGSYSFQVVLYVDGSIRFRYDSSSDANGNSNGGATIGVGEDSSYYDEYSYNSGIVQTDDVLYSPTIISGHVYEDPNGDSLIGDAVAVQDANVTLYDSGGTVLASTLTDSSGAYRFNAPVAETCYVVVDSTTVSSQQSFNSGSDQGDVWAEQTYGGVGAQCADGNGGTTTRSSAGSCFGGRRGDASDNPVTLGGAEHRIVIDTATTGSSVTGLDFAFSFNVVTSTRDNGDDDSSADRTIQGSLRQFIQNANALNGANVMRFVPSVIKNGINTNCWKITLSSALPQLSDASTTIDGTAYSIVDGTTIDNSNSGTQAMSGHVVGAGMDAIENSGDEEHLPVYEDKELEIDGGGTTTIFDCRQTSITIEDLAVYHGGTALYLNSSSDDGIFQRLYLGVRADGSDPGGGEHLSRAERSESGASNEKLLDSYIANVNATAVYFSGTGEIHGNYLYHNATSGVNNDAITTEGNGAKRSVILRNNYIDGAKAYGIESWGSGGGFTIEHNTVLNTGTDGIENGAIRIFGRDSVLRYNVAHSVRGAGVVVVRTGSRRAYNNIIQHNVLYGNGGLSIDLDQTHSSGNPNGDGVSPNNGTLNSNQRNNDMDYPVLTAATYDGSTLHIEGFVGSSAGQSTFANAELEIYKAADDGNNDGEIIAGDGASAAHGEGKEFFFGCQADGSGNIDCDYSIASLPAGLLLTLTATLSNEGTSEFSANYPISLLPKMQIAKSSCVVDDPVNATNPKRIPGATIRYAIEVTNAGVGTADSAVVTDDINTTYFDTGTITNLRIGSGSCSCLTPGATSPNGANGTANGVNPVKLDYGSVAVGATECGYFEVKIR